MTSTSSAIWEFALHVIALERQHDGRTDASEGPATRVCEKLRVPLVKLIGVAGYRALILRTVALAKREFPMLIPLEVQPDGSLQGFDKLGPNDAEAGNAVVVYLLSLLVTFIGKTLTIQLICNAWPEFSAEQTDLKVEKQL